VPKSSINAASQFIELTRIVRAAIILDHMYEFLEEITNIDDPLWEIWRTANDDNQVALSKLERAIDLGIDPGNLLPNDAGDNNSVSGH
jgi:hypothetical protein